MIRGKDIFFRSHNFHELCTGTRSDPNGFGDTAKAHIMKLFREVIRGTYTHKIETPAMYKGHTMQMFGLQRTFRVNGWGLALEYRGPELKDEIGTGMPDEIRIGNDQKCSETDEGFMKVFMSDELQNKTYETQAKRYAMLAGRDHWHISYTLENSPEEVVLKNARDLWKKGGESGYVPESFIDDVRALHCFDHLPDWARVKTFRVELTEADRVFFTQRAEMARNYFDELVEDYERKGEIYQARCDLHNIPINK